MVEFSQGHLRSVGIFELRIIVTIYHWANFFDLLLLRSCLKISERKGTIIYEELKINKSDVITNARETKKKDEPIVGNYNHRGCYIIVVYHIHALT